MSMIFSTYYIAVIITVTALFHAQPVTAQSHNALRTDTVDETFTTYSKDAEYVPLISRIIGKKEGQALADALSKPERDHLSRHSINLENERFSVYVPPQCSSENKCGIFAYIPANDNAKLPRGYQQGLDSYGLIYVAAQNSGNDHSPIERRIPLALHAVENIKAEYNIDPKRVYISGFSGGAKVAGHLGVGYGDIFSGALYICGSLPISATGIKLPLPKLKKAIQKENNFVFLTGKGDFNRDEIKRNLRSYRRSNFTQATLIDSSQMKHKEPKSSVFQKALEQLTQSKI